MVESRDAAVQASRAALCQGSSLTILQANRLLKKPRNKQTEKTEA